MRKKREPVKMEDAVSHVSKHLLAKRLAKIYRRMLKAQNLYAKPWPPGKKVEDDKRLFANFLQAAFVVSELGIGEEDFLRAQFECWNGPRNTYPFPAQIHSEGSVHRYNEWTLRHKKRLSGDIITRRQRKKKGFVRETKRLARLCEHLGKSERWVLLREYMEFSQAFLEYKGVWPKVASKWCEDREDSR